MSKGQLVAKIDPAPFEVKVRQAEADVANARAKVQKDQADLEFKRLTYERNRTLGGRNLISQNDVDTAKSNYDQAVAQLALDRASVQQTEAALQAARINLAYTDITSPVDGVVVARNVDVGQTVAASFQTPTLFLIAQDLTKMQVDTNVSESDIGDIRPGQPASFTVDAYAGRPFRGVVKQVRNAPITVQNVVTYDVVVAVDNPKMELKPGMTATVAITTAERDDVLRLPLRALRFHPEAKAGAGAVAATRARDKRRPSGSYNPTARCARSRSRPACATSSTPSSSRATCARATSWRSPSAAARASARPRLFRSACGVTSGASHKSLCRDPTTGGRAARRAVRLARRGSPCPFASAGP